MDTSKLPDHALLYPILAPDDLLALDLTGLDGAPARIHSAKVIVPENGQPYCQVTGVIAPAVRFEVRLPTGGWAQRFLMLGCGGYCGFVDADPTQRADLQGCAPIVDGSLVTAASDLGHAGNPRYMADGLWAINNICGVIDFAYLGTHKTTLVAKALIQAYYGQSPTQSYYIGCSDGGREGLQEAQRFPEDYDGILLGCPTIDVIATNTFYHAWHIRMNSRPDGTPILTADALAALARYICLRFGDAGGLIQDPRQCVLDWDELARPLIGTGFQLTEEQLRVIAHLWNGPTDSEGNRLCPPLPLGSEAGWQNALVPPLGKPMGPGHTFEVDWASDFPNYMARSGPPTGITWKNLSFDRKTFSDMHERSQFYDPTDPDLTAFHARGGKLLIWHGWADNLSSPYMSLNYVDAVRQIMGDAIDDFFALYLLPGVGHCNLGPRPTRQDFLTPLMLWVETGSRPDRVIVNFMEEGTVSMSRPAFRQPSCVAHDGQGNVAMHTSYYKTALPAGLPERMPWLGLAHYRSGHNRH